MIETYNICILGDRGVGKTSIIKHYTQDTLKASSAINIFVSKFHETPIEWWDFSGNPKYESLQKLFLKFFHGYILVFDISNKNSYKNIKKWEKKIHPWIIETESPILIVGNKEDLGITGEYTREFTLSSKNQINEDDWEKFLARVLSTDFRKIERLNKELEETKDKDSDTLMTRIQKWWKPVELPFNKIPK